MKGQLALAARCLIMIKYSNLQTHWPLTSLVPLGQTHVNPGATFVLTQFLPPVHGVFPKQYSEEKKKEFTNSLTF